MCTNMICKRKIAATFDLKTFEILKSYGFKIKVLYFCFYLNFYITQQTLENQFVFSIMLSNEDEEGNS